MHHRELVSKLQIRREVGHSPDQVPDRGSNSSALAVVVESAKLPPDVNT